MLIAMIQKEAMQEKEGVVGAGEGVGEGAGDSPIPHQIRGSLASFTQMSLESPAFDHCTACSLAVVERYKTERFAFVRDVCADSSILEGISGISDLMQDVDLDLCIDSDEEF